MSKNNIFSKVVVFVFSFVFLLMANNVLAAEIKLESNSKQILVGDTIAVDVLLNTEGESINVIEGNINVPSGLDLIEIKELSPASSVLSQWVRTPSWSEQNGSVSFVGGLPGGVNSKSATLFKIFFTAKSAGRVIFSPSDIKVYANDGLATQVGVHFDSLAIDIKDSGSSLIKDELQSVITKDFKSPANITVDLGQDPSVFDGQKFINISATDLESGIAYFEVKEGNRDPVKTNNSYVLQNQDELEPLVIFAFDKAGNVSKKVLTTYSPNGNYLFISVIIMSVGLILSLFVLYRIFKKGKLIK